jgi:hypothetical protein
MTKNKTGRGEVIVNADDYDDDDDNELMKTDRAIFINKLDIIIRDIDKDTCLSIDIAVHEMEM